MAAEAGGYPSSVEEIFADYTKRKNGILKALTDGAHATGARASALQLLGMGRCPEGCSQAWVARSFKQEPSGSSRSVCRGRTRAESDELFAACSPELDNLCLYGEAPSASAPARAIARCSQRGERRAGAVVASCGSWAARRAAGLARAWLPSALYRDRREGAGEAAAAEPESPVRQEQQQQRRDHELGKNASALLPSRGLQPAQLLLAPAGGDRGRDPTSLRARRSS